MAAEQMKTRHRTRKPSQAQIAGRRAIDASTSTCAKARSITICFTPSPST